MKTALALPGAVRTICKHDLINYRQALNTILAYNNAPIYDAYGGRCANITRSAGVVRSKADDETKELMDLVYLNRDTVSVESAADIMGIGKTTAYSMLNWILVQYALEMGYVQRKRLKTRKVVKEQWVS